MTSIEAISPFAVRADDGQAVGDRLRITIERPGVVDLVLDTFATEVVHEAITMEAGSPLVAASSGSGLTRQTPRLRRLIQVLAMAAETGDPVAYAPLWFDRPADALHDQQVRLDVDVTLPDEQVWTDSVEVTFVDSTLAATE